MGRSPKPRPTPGKSNKPRSGGRPKSTQRYGPSDWRAERDADVEGRLDARHEATGETREPATGETRPPAADTEKQPPFDLSRRIPNLRSFLNDHQAAAWDVASGKRITLFLGPAGTAKTHLAAAMALHELVIRQSVRKLVLCRPAVEAGERLGYLPGDAKAKVDPYMMPFYDMLDDMVGSAGKLREQVDARVEVAPVGFLRGRTFRHSFIVLDEAQNCSWTQLKLVMTRLGRGSRMVVTGDPDQSDLPGGGPNPLARLLSNLRHRSLDAGPYLGYYQFPESAIVRDDAVREVLRAFED